MSLLYLEDLEPGQRCAGGAPLRVDEDRMRAFAAEFDPQHRRELIGIRIELARTLGDMKPGFTLSARRYLRTVFRERPVRRDIARIEQRS